MEPGNEVAELFPGMIYVVQRELKHFAPAADRAYIAVMANIFDELEAVALHQGIDWRRFALQLANHLFTGIVIGIGIAVGQAIAG